MIPDPSRRLAPVVRLAPAKLNLTLAIVGPRPDGYHDLHSVMVPLGLADRLSLAAAAGEVDTLHVAGADAGPLAENLVLRAIALAREAVGAGWPGAGRAPALAARLEKRIPVAAGLGGGSSDAAAALDAALEAWGAELGPERRAEVSARLGSDVPFFVACRPAVVEGRGERVTVLPPIRGEPLGVLLVAPPVAVSTRDVFATYAAGVRPADRGAARASSDHLAAEASRGLSSSALLTRAGVIAAANGLLPATLALVPGLLAFRRALQRLLGRPVGQSGSGPTCFVLYPSLGEAETAGETVEAALAGGGLPAVSPIRADGEPRSGARATTTVIATTIAPGGDAPGGRAGA